MNVGLRKVKPMQKRLVIGLLLLVGLSAQAEIYKWVDENGKVQYGDQPPAAAKKQTLKITAQQGVTPPAPQQIKILPNETVKSAAEDPAVVKRNKEIAAHNCDLANTKLANSAHAYRITGTDAEGKTFTVSDAAASAYKLQLEKDRDRWCEEANK